MKQKIACGIKYYNYRKKRFQRELYLVSFRHLIQYCARKQANNDVEITYEKATKNYQRQDEDQKSLINKQQTMIQTLEKKSPTKAYHLVLNVNSQISDQYALTYKDNFKKLSDSLNKQILKELALNKQTITFSFIHNNTTNQHVHLLAFSSEQRLNSKIAKAKLLKLNSLLNKQLENFINNETDQSIKLKADLYKQSLKSISNEKLKNKLVNHLTGNYFNKEVAAHKKQVYIRGKVDVDTLIQNDEILKDSVKLLENNFKYYVKKDNEVKVDSSLVHGLICEKLEKTFNEKANISEDVIENKLTSQLATNLQNLDNNWNQELKKEYDKHKEALIHKHFDDDATSKSTSKKTNEIWI